MRSLLLLVFCAIFFPVAFSQFSLFQNSSSLSASCNASMNLTHHSKLFQRSEKEYFDYVETCVKNATRYDEKKNDITIQTACLENVTNYQLNCSTLVKGELCRQSASFSGTAILYAKNITFDIYVMFFFCVPNTCSSNEDKISLNQLNQERGVIEICSSISKCAFHLFCGTVSPEIILIVLVCLVGVAFFIIILGALVCRRRKMVLTYQPVVLTSDISTPASSTSFTSNAESQNSRKYY